MSLLFLVVFIPYSTLYTQKIFSEQNLDELHPVIVELLSCPYGDSDLARVQSYFRDSCQEVIYQAKSEGISYAFLEEEVRKNQIMTTDRKRDIQYHLDASYRKKRPVHQAEKNHDCAMKGWDGYKCIILYPLSETEAWHEK